MEDGREELMRLRCAWNASHYYGKLSRQFQLHTHDIVMENEPWSNEGSVLAESCHIPYPTIPPHACIGLSVEGGCLCLQSCCGKITLWLHPPWAVIIQAHFLHSPWNFGWYKLLCGCLHMSVGGQDTGYNTRLAHDLHHYTCEDSLLWYWMMYLHV